MKYISHYPKHLQEQVQKLLDTNKLKDYILSNIKTHSFTNDKTLYDYTMDLKMTILKISNIKSSL